MGRGSMYSYEYFMLIDDTEMDEFEQEMFLQDVKELLEITNYGYRHKGRDAFHLGETTSGKDTIYYGIDYGGDLPCIFATYKYTEDDAEEYEAEHGDTYEEYRERVEEQITKAFTHLIKNFVSGTFGYPTSAWTSVWYDKNDVYSY